jgi:DNA-binding transcriptional MerR regulator
VVELVKLYYRIGEVAQIVGVQPHVLRYWETEFRTIRPQKSGKGQRVYSRKDVEKLLRVKDLLKNQGFTIAGAKKKLREPDDVTEARGPSAPAPALSPVEVGPLTPVALAPERFVAAPPPAARAAPEREVREAPAPAPVPPPLFIPAPAFVAAPAPAAVPAAAVRERAAYRENQARVREALLSLREEMVGMLGDLDRAPPRRPKLPTVG